MFSAKQVSEPLVYKKKSKPEIAIHGVAFTIAYIIFLVIDAICTLCRCLLPVTVILGAEILTCDDGGVDETAASYIAEAQASLDNILYQGAIVAPIPLVIFIIIVIIITIINDKRRSREETNDDEYVISRQNIFNEEVKPEDKNSEEEAH